MRTRRLAPLLIAVSLVLPAAPLATQLAASGAEVEAAAKSRGTSPLVIDVLSNRADLVSGGDALVSVELPSQVDAGKVRVYVGDREVTEQFGVRPNGEFQGLVEGLQVGENVVRVEAQGYAGQRVITNHPNGGPVFSGPQHGPYQCQSTAQDDQCNEPASYSLLYKSTDQTKPGLHPYDPENPPSDVATTTTDQGVTVPFIVRRESGYQARDRYAILTLFQEGETWEPWKPQEQWNGKVLATHGGGCGASYSPGSPRLDDYSGTFSDAPVENSYVTALGRGFAVMSTALNNTGHNCNLVTQAESMAMAKERLVEQYGPVRYTIGTGCSGGSIAQHTIANAYPGVYQGLVTTCSYPDVLTAGAQFADYHLLRLYFEDSSRWGEGVVWEPNQMAQVEGHATHMNAVTADEGLFKDAINPENACSGTKDTVPGDPSTRYDSETNPAGVRCSILDMMINPLGPRPESVWTPEEQAAGRGFTGVPFANVGVQYGLGALKEGLITPAQFVDLNVKVGGLDINADPVETRLEGDPGAIANVYRSGLVNEANHLDEVAMINHGGPDPGLAHDYAHAFWTEERLQRDQGHTDNRVMWFGEAPMIGDIRWATEAFLAMDRWLAAVEEDGRDLPLSQKIVEDRPEDVTDRCENVPGVNMKTLPGGDVVCEQPTLQTRLSTPREVAGDDTANDRVACQTRPLERADYDFLPVPFTDEQWATLEATFPNGVCDWSKPGQGQGPAETWLTYADPNGNVVYGGQELPPVPAGSGTGWASPAFHSLLEQ